MRDRDYGRSDDGVLMVLAGVVAGVLLWQGELWPAAGLVFVVALAFASWGR